MQHTNCTAARSTCQLQATQLALLAGFAGVLAGTFRAASTVCLVLHGGRNGTLQERHGAVRHLQAPGK